MLTEKEQAALTLALTAWRLKAQKRYQLDRIEFEAMSRRHFALEFPGR